jgi:hypothetical protein
VERRWLPATGRQCAAGLAVRLRERGDRRPAERLGDVGHAGLLCRPAIARAAGDRGLRRTGTRGWRQPPARRPRTSHPAVPGAGPLRRASLVVPPEFRPRRRLLRPRPVGSAATRLAGLPAGRRRAPAQARRLPGDLRRQPGGDDQRRRAGRLAGMEQREPCRPTLARPCRQPRPPGRARHGAGMRNSPNRTISVPV